MKTKDKIVGFLIKNRTAALALSITLVGSVAIVGGGTLLYRLLVDPEIPSIDHAPMEKIADFFAHPRGLARLPVEEKRHMIYGALDRYNAPGQRRALKDHLLRMSEAERSQILDAVVEIGREQVAEDAREYESLPPEERDAFVDSKVAEYASMRGSLVGAAGGVNLAGAFAGDSSVPASSGALSKALASKTTASERAKSRNFVNKVEQRASQQSRHKKSKQGKGKSTGGSSGNSNSGAAN